MGDGRKAAKAIHKYPTKREENARFKCPVWM